MRISGIVKESIVDGPGIRYVVFTQGCLHHCPGCHNSSTWDMNGGQEINVEDICKDIDNLNPLVTGITLSGGEPFLQLVDCIQIVTQAKHNNLSVWCYTGYTYESLINVYSYNDSYKYILTMTLLKYIDVLVDGPFIESKKSLDLRFRGSTNQRLIDVKKSMEEKKVILYKE